MPPTVLNRSTEIILANWPDNEQITWNVNNDILVKIPSNLYVLVNRSVLCNCRIEVENNFPLESLAACHDVRIQTSNVFYSEYSFCQLS